MKENRYKGFPRRIQWQLKFKQDAKELRSILASHVSTINLLLMTQTIRSITKAEDDRVEMTCGLEQEILAHRRLLENVNVKVEASLSQHSDALSKLKDHGISFDTLIDQAKSNGAQLQDQGLHIRKVQSSVESIYGQTTSLLASASQIPNLVASCLVTARSLSEQLSSILTTCCEFTLHMRLTFKALLELFSFIQASLLRIECTLLKSVNLPIVKFTDALGETRALPYDLCQQWPTFKALIDAMFIGKPGKARVEQGQYLIIHDKGGRAIQQDAWSHTFIRQDDHLSMCIVLDELVSKTGYCPFPSCQASLKDAVIRNGGKLCSECARWTLSTFQHLQRSSVAGDDRQRNSEHRMDMPGRSVEEGEQEDIEAYRLIKVTKFIRELTACLHCRIRKSPVRFSDIHSCEVVGPRLTQ